MCVCVREMARKRDSGVGGGRFIGLHRNKEK